MGEENTKMHDFTEAVEATEEALEEVEAKVRAGNDDVTGLELLEARSNHEVAQMRLDGATNRARRYGDWLGKAHTRKDVAEIVRDVLVQGMVPGANSYATFGGGFRRDTAVPDSLPFLTVTQLDGGVGADGVGDSSLRITWFRAALHSPLAADRLSATLEDAGFRVDRSFGLNDGVKVMPREGADEVEVRLYKR